jgi:hypothetical protein
MTIYNIIALAYAFYSMPNIHITIKQIFKRDISIFSILDCSKCLSFWIVLLVTQNLTVALLVSLAVLLMDSFIVTRL